MGNIYFSLVLYNHTIDDIRPLLSSLCKLSESKSIARACYGDIALLIKDNSPSPRITFDELLCFIDNTFDFDLIQDCSNIGFGRAHNLNCFSNNYIKRKDYLVVVNPDIWFDALQLELLLGHFIKSPVPGSVACSPLIKNKYSFTQLSVKRNPTLLALLVSRFNFLQSFSFFASYLARHQNVHIGYDQIIFSQYLSGCFLLIKYSAFFDISGFTEKYFLHFEDADICRKLSNIGLVYHFPDAFIYHGWARGSHGSLKQTIHLLHSYFIYIQKWGFDLL